MVLNLLLHHLCVLPGVGEVWEPVGCLERAGLHSPACALTGLWRVGTPALQSFLWAGRRGQDLPALPQLLLCSGLCAFQRNEKYDYAAHIP